MALVVICGQPSSGKSSVATKLKEELTTRGSEVRLVDEPSLHLTRGPAYVDTPSEKATRGALRAATERSLARTCITIMDSLNNIKGYRYELWCLARAAGVKYCMVHVDTPTEQCREWNAAREGDTYPQPIFEDLASRFERPDARNRWDAPLFTLRPAGDAQEFREGLLQVADAVAPPLVNEEQQQGQQEQQGGSTGAEADNQDLWETASIRSATGGALLQARALKPTSATAGTLMLGTNVLHGIDQAVQDVVDAVMAAQEAAAGGPGGLIRLSKAAQPVLQLDQAVSMAELRRHKRAFLKLATKITFSRLSDAGVAQRMFIDYLIDNVAGASRPPRIQV